MSPLAQPPAEPAAPVVSWRITTKRALTRPIVPAFLAVLRKRLRSARFDEEAVATALHEAVANAAIHGNLGITAAAAGGVDAADALARQVETGLNDCVLSARPLVISAMRQHARLIVSVLDAGSGFDAVRLMRPQAGMPHGRGVQLMRAMARHVEYQNGGRLVLLTFMLTAAAETAADAVLDGSGQPSVLSSRILVADDSGVQRDLITRWLADAGFSDIVHATDGNEAIRLYYETGPDLILLDVAMPGMDGIEVCRTLTSRHPGIVPVLMLSAIPHADERVRAFDAGAVDFIVKPIYPPELIARVRIHLDRSWLLQSLHQFRARLGDELNAARLMQQSLLPSAQALDAVRATMGLDIAACSEMSSELGGDIWGVRIIDAARLGVFIADFTGHGVASAMNAFRLHAVLGETGIRFERPDLVMQALNVRLSAVLPVGSFATLFYGVIDTTHDQLHYTAAGAPPPVLALPDGSLHDIDTSGMPVGIRPWQAYDVHTLSFPPGASILLYSDALMETADRHGDCWSTERLRAVLAPDSSAASGERTARLLQAFYRGRPRPLPDDLTVIFVRRIIEVAASAGPSSATLADTAGGIRTMGS